MATETIRSPRKSASLEKEPSQQAQAEPESPSMHDKIRDRAFQIWLENGCPTGRDLENWRQAEHELTQSCKSSAAK